MSHPNEAAKTSTSPAMGVPLTDSSGSETHQSPFTHELINSKREVPMSY